MVPYSLEGNHHHHLNRHSRYTTRKVIMAAASVPVKCLDEITECPICREVFTDPRELPCVHTYCLKCIKDWCKDKRNGDNGSCPQCRKEFQIPEHDINDLPKNIFVTKLLLAKEISASQTVTKICDVCKSSQSETSNNKTAEVFCLDCQMNICEPCFRIHLTFKHLSSHKTIRLQEQVKEEDLYAICPPAYCEKHKYEQIKIYCFDCKTVSCMMCYIEIHSGHKCSDVNKVSAEFHSKLVEDIEELDGVT